MYAIGQRVPKDEAAAAAVASEGRACRPRSVRARDFMAWARSSLVESNGASLNPHMHSLATCTRVPWAGSLSLSRSFFILLLVALSGVLSILSSGCATTPQYRAKASSPIDGAQVRGASEFHWFGHWYRIRLEEVDGEKVNTSVWTDWKRPILIDPGDRVIRVGCVFSPDGSRTESISVDLNISLLAGHNYKLRCGIEGKSVAFWAEDTETHQKVGMQRLSVSPDKGSPAQTAAGVTALLLFRLLLLMGTGQ